jgi:hypothetical protein
LAWHAAPLPPAGGANASVNNNLSASFSAAEQTAARETMLATLANALSTGAPMASPADAASAANAVASLAAQPSMLSSAASTSALAALAALAAQPPAALGTDALAPLGAGALAGAARFFFAMSRRDSE